jgi:hypothetical protein
MGLACQDGSMPKRSRKTTDVNEIARSIIAQATGEEPTAEPERTEPEAPKKDPAAVALGRKGGLKGGAARAAKMTPKQRSASAKKAAKARWSESAKSKP